MTFYELEIAKGKVTGHGQIDEKTDVEVQVSATSNAVTQCTIFAGFELIIVGQMGLIGNAKIKYVNGDDKSDTFFGKGLLPAAVFVSSSTGSIIGSLLGPILWNLGQTTPGLLGFCGTAINVSVWIFYYKYHHHHDVNHVGGNASQSV